jgi:hypothetical protein
VLAVLTLQEKDEGLSWSTIYRKDVDDNDSYDFGPTLTETGGGHIGDSDGNGVLDAQLSAGRIAVGRSCKDPPPTPNVPRDVIVVPTVHTPDVETPALTPTPTNGLDGSTPEPDNDGSVTPTPPDDATATRSRGRTPTPTTRGINTGGSDGGGSGGLSPLLAACIGAGGGAGIIASYIVLKAVRRTA